MKWSLKTFALALCLPVVLLVLAWRPGSAGPGGAASGEPKLELLEPVFNFGTVPQGEVVSHTFTIRNGGSGLLDIRGVQASCGCTAAKPTRERLAPGETAQIAVSFDTRSQKGHPLRTVTLLTNDPHNPKAALSLEGEIKVEFVATPAEVSFGDVPRGSEVRRQVLISDLSDGKGLKTEPVAHSNPNISATQGPRQDGKTGAVLNVVLLKSMPVGPFSDTLSVQTSRAPLRIEVFGNVTGDLTASPRQVSFGIVPRGHGAVRIIRLSNAGGRPVKVLGVESSSPGVVASAKPITEGREYKITIELRPHAAEGQLKGRLAVQTDDPQQSTLIIPFYGIVGSFKG